MEGGLNDLDTEEPTPAAPKGSNALFAKALQHIACHVKRLEGNIEIYPLSSKGTLRSSNHPQYGEWR